MFLENLTGSYAAVQAKFFFEAISTKLTPYNATLRTAKYGGWAMRPVRCMFTEEPQQPNMRLYSHMCNSHVLHDQRVIRFCQSAVE